jgi:hypothetical protein
LCVGIGEFGKWQARLIQYIECAASCMTL